MKKIVLISLLLIVIGLSGCTSFAGFECSSDEDCVPAQCCHPTSCVPKDKALDCSGIACTMECAPGTMDCGQGYCSCVEGKCEVVWTE